MRSFFKLACILLAAILIICGLSACEEKRNTDPTIDAPATEPSTGGDFLKPPTYSVAIDHTVLPNTLAEKVGEEELALYKKAVKTYLDFGNSVKFESGVKYGAVIKLIESYFPVIYCDTSGPTVNVEDNTIGWTYKVETKAEHDKAVTDFTDKAEAYLTGLRYDDSDTEVAMVIYERLYNNIEYNEADAPSEKPEEDAEDKEEEVVLPNSPFSPIFHKKGDDETISKAYCYLLTQAGFDALDIYCDFEAEAGPSRFYFMALKLEDKWYYSDPGEGVRYDSFTRFAFSDSVLSGFGMSEPANPIFSAFTKDALNTVIVCDSERFFDLTGGANKVELDTAKDSMLFETDIGTKWNFTRLHG